MLELWVVRHGQTDWNVQHRVQGWTDVPLNDVGHAQAEALGIHLEGIPFRALYTSDLGRALTTANILSSYIGLQATVDARLREKRFGAIEGQIRHSKHTVQHPQEQRVVHAIHLRSGQGTSDDPIAETDEELSRRVQAFLAHVETQTDRGRVLAVTHGGLIRALLDFVHGEPSKTLQNTSVTRLRKTDASWEAQSVNWTGHLDAKVVTSDSHSARWDSAQRLPRPIVQPR